MALLKTKKQVDKQYRDCILKWLDKFGLGRWSVKFIEWNELPEINQDGEAATSIHVPSRCVKFAINYEIAKTKTDKWIDRCALHEVAHLLTERLAMMAFESDHKDEEVEEEMEAIAKACERCFFGPIDE